MKHILRFSLLLSLLICLDACGKKGHMNYPGGQKDPKFDKVLDPGNNF